MNPQEKLQTILHQNNGIITTAQANKIGISNEQLRLFVKNKSLERLIFGVYISPDEYEDMLYAMQLRKSKIIYSHDTALFLHNLTDQSLIDYTVTVPSGYNTSNLYKDDLRVFTIKKELHNINTVKIKTTYNNEVTCYDMERTICDCIRNRNQMDIAIVIDAIKFYVKRKEKDLYKLMLLAELLHVSKLLRTYLEVLL